MADLVGVAQQRAHAHRSNFLEEKERGKNRYQQIIGQKIAARARRFAVQCSIIAAVCNSTVPGHHCHSMGTVTVFFHDLRECTSKRAKRVGVPYHSILPHNGVVVITICTTPISFMAFRLQNFGLFLCCCSFHLFQFVLHYVVIYSFHSN